MNPDARIAARASLCRCGRWYRMPGSFRLPGRRRRGACPRRGGRVADPGPSRRGSERMRTCWPISQGAPGERRTRKARARLGLRIFVRTCAPMPAFTHRNGSGALRAPRGDPAPVRAPGNGPGVGLRGSPSEEATRARGQAGRRRGPRSSAMVIVRWLVSLYRNEESPLVRVILVITLLAVVLMLVAWAVLGAFSNLVLIADLRDSNSRPAHLVADVLQFHPWPWPVSAGLAAFGIAFLGIITLQQFKKQKPQKGPATPQHGGE